MEFGSSDDKSQKLLYLILSQGIKVKTINIDGLKSVKQDVIIPHIKPMLQSNNILNLLTKINKSREVLINDLNAFDNVVVNISRLPRTGSVQEVALNVAVVEPSKTNVGMSMNSDISSNDGSLKIYGKVRNLFGRLESFTVNYTRGTKVADGCDVVFNKPILSKVNSNIKYIVSKENVLNRTAGFNMSNYKSGILYQLEMLGGINVFEVGSLWQQIHGSQAPVKIREEFGHHIKCSVRHAYTRDKRDDKLVPTRGSKLRLESEIAGFLGDINHVKVDGEIQGTLPLLLGISGTCTLRGGIIKSLNDTSRVHITDMFVCGGPGSVRGFFADGVGPQASNRPLGGVAHWGAGLSLTRRLPFNPYIWGLGQYMRVQAFVNAGNLVSDQSELLQNPRVSVGSGIIIKVANTMKMEINYALPIRHQPSDVVNHGLQFGIGLNFL